MTNERLPCGAGRHVTQDMISHILRLHELGLSQKAIRINLRETCHLRASLKQINRITGRFDHLVDDWIVRLKKEGI